MTLLTNKYTDLIAGYHFDKPLFAQWVYTLTQPLITAQSRLAEMQADFDIDTAVGVQLDAVGVRVGISRKLPVSITGVFFSFDIAGVGFDEGVWLGRYESPEGITSLDDGTYRNILKTKVLVNHWDGTVDGLYYLLNQVSDIFGCPIKYKDNQNMTVNILLPSKTTPPIVWNVLSRGLVDITTAGVSVYFYQDEESFLNEDGTK